MKKIGLCVLTALLAVVCAFGTLGTVAFADNAASQIANLVFCAR